MGLNKFFKFPNRIFGLFNPPFPSRHCCFHILTLQTLLYLQLFQSLLLVENMKCVEMFYMLISAVIFYHIYKKNVVGEVCVTL